MLVLARKLGQSIIVDNCIEITVVEVRGDQVRLGLTAPKTISIYRKELLEQIKSENIAAASSAGLPVLRSAAEDGDEAIEMTEGEEHDNTKTGPAGPEPSNEKRRRTG